MSREVEGFLAELAEVVTWGPPEQLGARLLVADEPLRSFLGEEQTSWEVVCTTR